MNENDIGESVLQSLLIFGVICVLAVLIGHGCANEHEETMLRIKTKCDESQKVVAP